MSYVRQPAPCPADKPIGIAIMAMAVLCAVSGAALIGMMSYWLPVLNSDGEPLSIGQGAPFTQGVLAVPLIILTIIAVAQFSSGFGILHGKKWGFWLGLVFNVLAIFAGNASSALAAAIALYCILRLTGSVGSRPV